MRVSDNGVPPLTDEVLVNITINRNLWTPAFNPLNYNVTIPETVPTGSEIGVTVTATDRDLNASILVIFYNQYAKLKSLIPNIYNKVDHTDQCHKEVYLVPLLYS